MKKNQDFPLYRLIRFKQNNLATLGNFTDSNGKIICATLEPPWKWNFRDNKKTKNNEASCIPAGKYLCRKFSGKKFQDVWEITGVPGRDAILIHAGNYPAETHGCILVGNKHLEYNAIPLVNDSRNTLNKLREFLPDIFWLNIECVGFNNSLCDL